MLDRDDSSESESCATSSSMEGVTMGALYSIAVSSSSVTFEVEEEEEDDDDDEEEEEEVGGNVGEGRGETTGDCSPALFLMRNPGDRQRGSKISSGIMKLAGAVADRVNAPRLGTGAARTGVEHRVGVVFLWEYSEWEVEEREGGGPMVHVELPPWWVPWLLCGRL